LDEVEEELENEDREIVVPKFKPEKYLPEDPKERADFEALFADIDKYGGEQIDRKHLEMLQKKYAHIDHGA